mmetsp:Transcript_7352/g.8541  ORF Transcript_7352/g.8541 Transcript_7352/m.8541 type:complete len:170 (+) Transcript_7352:323-832(+)
MISPVITPTLSKKNIQWPKRLYQMGQRQDNKANWAQGKKPKQTITPMEILPRTNPMGITINKNTHIVPMDIDPPIVSQRNSVLEEIESRNINYTPRSPIFLEEFLPIVSTPVRRKSTPTSKTPLFSTIGKKTNNMKHPDASFTSKYPFRHLVPFLYTEGYLSKTDKEKT